MTKATGATKTRKPTQRPLARRSANATAPKQWTARELMQLSPEERGPILEGCAKLAEQEYKNNAELTEFTRSLAGDPIFEY